MVGRDLIETDQPHRKNFSRREIRIISNHKVGGFRLSSLSSHFDADVIHHKVAIGLVGGDEQTIPREKGSVLNGTKLRSLNR